MRIRADLYLRTDRPCMKNPSVPLSKNPQGVCPADFFMPVKELHALVKSRQKRERCLRFLYGKTASLEGTVFFSR